MHIYALFMIKLETRGSLCEKNSSGLCQRRLFCRMALKLHVASQDEYFRHITGTAVDCIVYNKQIAKIRDVRGGVESAYCYPPT